MLEDIKLLPYFINEDLVLLPQDRKPQATAQQGVATPPPGQEQAPEAAASTPASATGAPVKPASGAPQTTTKTPAPEKENKPAVNPNLIFGKNQKELLVLVEDFNNPVMERADGLLLKDILKAIGYTFDDVAIVNISHCREDADWEAVNTIPFKTMFSFGITTPKLPFTSTLAPYELERSGEKRFLLTDKLAVLRQDRSRKIALWNLLKQFFV